MNRFYLLLFWPLLLSIVVTVSLFYQENVLDEYVFLFVLVFVGSVVPFTWAFIFPQRPYKHQYRLFILGGLIMSTAFGLIPLNDLFLDLKLPMQELLVVICYGVVIYFYNLRTKFYPQYSSKKAQRNLAMKVNGFMTYLVAGAVSVILVFIFKSEDNGIITIVSTVENIALIAAGYGYYREAIHWHKHGESSELAARIEEIGKTNE